MSHLKYMIQKSIVRIVHAKWRVRSVDHLSVLFHRRSSEPMKPICGRDWEQQLPAADLADSMELAPSCLCFFAGQLAANVKPTARHRSAGHRGPVAGTLGFTGTRRFPSVVAGEQLLFRENRPEGARVANNFAQFALNWPERTGCAGPLPHARARPIYALAGARGSDVAGVRFRF